MFIRIIKDVIRRLGYYCSPAQSIRDNGKPSHKTIFNFGFVPYDRILYVNAVSNEGHPEEILSREIVWIEQISENCVMEIAIESIKPIIIMQEEGSQSFPTTEPTFFQIQLFNYVYYLSMHKNSARISKARSL